MARTERTGKRKTREQISRKRPPELGYYFIVTDTKEAEQNYIYGWACLGVSSGLNSTRPK